MSLLLTIGKLFAVFIFLAGLVIPTAVLATDHQKILILHSYNKGLAWTDNIMAGMESVFAPASERLEIHVEYMDTKWFPPEQAFDALETLYSRKYARTKFDALLLSDNNALTFVLSRRESLFPGVPVIFCGINDFRFSMLEGQSGITGITEEIDVTGTISLALELVPHLTTFYVINDRTPTARANQHRMNQAEAAMAGKDISFIHLNPITAHDLSQRLSSLPQNAGVLLFTFHKDSAGQWFSIKDYLSLVHDSSSAPVFAFWDHYLGSGIMGGRVVSGREQGRRCAEYAMKILGGTEAAALPIIIKSPNVDLLDYHQLVRFKVDPQRIPGEALVLNKPESVVAKYRNTLIASGVAVVLLIAVLILMSVNAAIRRKSMAALKASEARHRGLVDATKDLVWSMDTRGRITYVNQAILPLLGYFPHEVLGKDVCRFLEAGDVDTARQLLGESLENRTGWTGRALTWIRKNGELVSLESTGHPLFDPGGTLTGFSGIDRDVTLRRKTEEVLKESEEKFRRIFENSVVGFFQSTPGGKFINVNPAFARMLKYDAPQDLLAAVTDITRQYYVDPADRDRYRRCLKEAGQVDGLEFRVKCRDGSQIWVSNSTRAYFDPEGNITHYEGVITDITKRKLAEEALEKRIVALTRPLDNGSAPITFEELFNLEEIQKLQNELAQAMGVASIITDPRGIPITRPSNFCRLCTDIVGDTGRGPVACFKADAAAAGRSSHAIRTCESSGLWNATASIRIQGTHIANWLIGQVRDPDLPRDTIRARAKEIGADPAAFETAFDQVPAMPRGQFEQLTGTLHTLASLLSNTAFQNLQQARLITALQRSEKDQRALQSQLIQAQKMESVGRLAGGVAHDFNNMLSIISGNADLILSDLDPHHPFNESLQEIQKAAQRSTELTRQLLAFARKQAISPRAVNLNQALEGMFKMLSRLIGEDIQLTWHPSPDLWSVRMDPSQVDQILANLCVNARDAIEGVGSVRIETRNCAFDEADCLEHSQVRPGEFVLLAIRDDGAGMDSHTLENLFDPFFTTKGVGQGTGLGLATVYGIVKQNSGFIHVDSAPGEGTTFNIYFPRYIPDPETAGKESSTENGPALPPSPGGRETILLVEDEVAILRMTTLLLEQLGYRVLPAASPGEALEISRQEGKDEIHLLLTDVIMPEMNGKELARELTGENPELKCLFMSGYTEDVIAHHGVLDQGLNFIAKPFTRETMAKKLREILDPGAADQGS